MNVGEVSFNIDDSRVHIISRASRLRAVAIGWLTAMKDALEKDANAKSEDVVQVAEAIVWLNELET